MAEGRVQAMSFKTNIYLQTTQKQYNLDCNCCDCKISTFYSGNFVFIARPPLSRTNFGITDNIVTAAYN